MKYFFFNPFSKQYLFPKDFNKHTIFATFYQPYTLAGTIIWYVWRFIPLLRNISSTKKIDNFIPKQYLQKYVPNGTVMAFNRGTKGIEQKITILGISPSENKPFFIKLAVTPSACENIANEGAVLKQLSHLSFVPALLQLVVEQDFTLIKTSVITGNRMSIKPIDHALIKILHIIANQDIYTKKSYPTELRSSFAHGDFCPWNMMEEGNKIKIYDWEMGGIYPLGYDLFTYIFQVEFLICKNNRFEHLLDFNANLTNLYFEKWVITDWKPYLLAFANIKVELESKKDNQKMWFNYKKLAEYAASL